MMRHPRFCVFGLTVTLTLVLCLLSTVFPIGSYAEASLLLPGQVFIAQASSNDGDDPEGADDLPPGPPTYEKTSSHVKKTMLSRPMNSETYARNGREVKKHSVSDKTFPFTIVWYFRHSIPYFCR